MMKTNQTKSALIASRRYDIDWIRVLAIGLLLIYHVSIGFQFWGIMIGFIVNSETLESIWIPMSMLNVWRIPILFFISGMGVFFALRKRNFVELIKERSTRILLPFLFGMFCIVPIHIYIFQHYYDWDLSYGANPAHLWFLGNIFLYVVMLSPLFFYMKKNRENRMISGFLAIIRHPLGICLVISAFMIEVFIIQPNPYELYAMTWHGFALGFLAFFFGFCFVLSGDEFWKTCQTWRWVYFITASSLFLTRTFWPDFLNTNVFIVVESISWIYSIFAFGYRYLNRPSPILAYLSQAAYPIYIIHMILIYWLSSILFPLEINGFLKFIIVVVGTCGGSFILYEFGIRRLSFVRPLFGLKIKT